jgi:cytochrome c peroxidase
LPPWVKLANDPSATSIVVNRCIPTTIDTPSFVKAGQPGIARLMVDGRNTTLQQQALGAIHDHAENTIEPTPEELDLIAAFQQSDSRFFSSEAVQDFASGEGPAPPLPEGTTDSEQRGRLMFVDAPLTAGSTNGICALCHSGPMLNQANSHSFAPFGTPPGIRFFDIGVTQPDAPLVGTMNNKVYDFVVTNDDGTQVFFSSPDPGAILNNPRFFPPFAPKSFGINFFRTPILRGITKNAPYFHDNSAKTLEDVATHYRFFFEDADGINAVIPGGIHLTAQDEADMVAFLKLL